MANRPPSSCTIGRSSGGITGTASSTMPIGELPDCWNAATTLRRLRARSFFCPLPFLMTSRSDLGLGVDVEVLDELLDRLRAHGALEVLAVAVDELAVEHLVDDQLLGSQLGEGGPDLLEPVQLTLGTVAELTHLALAAVADLAPDVGLGALLLELGFRSASSFCARASRSASR